MSVSLASIYREKVKKALEALEENDVTLCKEILHPIAFGKNRCRDAYEAIQNGMDKKEALVKFNIAPSSYYMYCRKRKKLNDPDLITNQEQLNDPDLITNQEQSEKQIKTTSEDKSENENGKLTYEDFQ